MLAWSLLAWSLSFAAHALLGAFTVVLVWTDLREQTLPNRLIAWATFTVIPLLCASGLVSRDWSGLLLAWSGAIVFGLAAFLGWLRWRTRFGAGDVKLMPVAAFAAVWGPSGHERISALLVFPLFVCGGMLVFGLAALMLKRERFAAGPVILGASWLTMIVLSQPFGAPLAR